MLPACSNAHHRFVFVREGYNRVKKPRRNNGSDFTFSSHHVEMPSDDTSSRDLVPLPATAAGDP